MDILKHEDFVCTVTVLCGKILPTQREAAALNK